MFKKPKSEHSSGKSQKKKSSEPEASQMAPEEASVEETVAEMDAEETETCVCGGKCAQESAAEKAAADALAELAVVKDRYMRLLADFDNMRKRQIREREDVVKRANEGLLESLIPVFDHLELAIANASGDDSFTQGVKMVAGQFLSALTAAGAESIDATGKVFDPAWHEALQVVPSDTVPENEVVQQFRKGWSLGGKLMRPAQVVVSSGKPESEADALEADSEEA